MLTSGMLGGFSETPWARSIAQNLKRGTVNLKNVHLGKEGRID